MECNKEEAIRAMEIAEKKMLNSEFEGARKFALKARQLYPEIDNISQLLMVCEVHCSAANKLNGSEMDWYGILQIERFSDEAIIKKQYRKLALSLHPDKNKFTGAEAAFKLIGEANRLLTDPTKRQVYDMKCRAFMRAAAPKLPAPKPPAPKPPAPHQSNRNSLSKKQNEAMNKFSGIHYSQFASPHSSQQSQPSTFWTSCPSCGIRYQYFRDFLNKMLRCHSCQQNFLAHDLGIPSGASWCQFVRVPNHGSPKSAPHSSDGKHAGLKVEPTAKAGKNGLFSGDSEPKASKAGNGVEIGVSSKLHEKSNGHVKVGVGNEGVAVPKPDGKRPKQSAASKSASRKRGRNPIGDSSDSHDTASSDGNEGNFVMPKNGSNPSSQNNRASEDHEPRRSSRQKQNISYKENLSEDDNDFVLPTSKRPKVGGSSSATEVETRESAMNGGVLKEDDSASSAAAASSGNGNKKEAKQKATSTLEESLPKKKSKIGDCQRGEEATVVGKADTDLGKNDAKSTVDDDCKPDLDDVQESEAFDYPDPDFSNFEKDKAEDCFAVNQFWAIYDPLDSMPRFYARVKKVLSSGSKLQITWLEASSDDKSEQKWSEVELPVGCGKFEIGETQTVDHSIFSHQMYCIGGRRRGTYLIYPKKGETWAIFKGWDINWSSEPERHRPPHEFEFVEVLKDLSDNVAVGVAYLGKVNGFVSIFQRAPKDGIQSFLIPPYELYRFSHRVPSFRMTGKEGEGVPEGSFELDPSCLPSNLFNVGDGCDAMREKEKLDAGAIPSCSKSPKDKVNLSKGCEKICSLMKNENDPKRGTTVLGLSARGSNKSWRNGDDSDVRNAGQYTKVDDYKDESHGNINQSEISVPSYANEKVKTPTKQKKSELAADVLKPRRSPRDLSKSSSSSQVNGSRSTTKEDIDKHSTTHKGQASATSSQSDDKINMKDGGLNSVPKSPLSSGRKVLEVPVDKYDFKNEKSEDKFQLDQIWALYSDKDGLPKIYAQVKKIHSNPELRLHVAMLEPFPRPKDITQPACCGIFKVNSGKTYVFPVTKFSHQLKAYPLGKNKYEIYPRKGEIWAVYRNGDSDKGLGECDIVQVLEVDNRGAKAVVMQRERVNGSGFFYSTPRIQRSKTGVLEILRSEFGRFSHQCSACQKGEKNSLLRGYWELDPASVPSIVVLLD